MKRVKIGEAAPVQRVQRRSVLSLSCHLRRLVEGGEREGLTVSERDEPKALQRENRELKQANEILRKGEGEHATGSRVARTLFSQRRIASRSDRPPTETMIMFIANHRQQYGRCTGPSTFSPGISWAGRCPRPPNTKLVLDALDQALAARTPDRDRLVHYGDRGVQYFSIKYSERLGEAKIGASVGSVGDSHDNALAETINGLYKAEVIEHQGPWTGKRDIEMATLKWVHDGCRILPVRRMRKKRMPGIRRVALQPKTTPLHELTDEQHQTETAKHLRFAVLHLFCASDTKGAQAVDDLIDMLEGVDEKRLS